MRTRLRPPHPGRGPLTWLLRGAVQACAWQGGAFTAYSAVTAAAYPPPVSQTGGGTAAVDGADAGADVHNNNGLADAQSIADGTADPACADGGDGTAYVHGTADCSPDADCTDDAAADDAPDAVADANGNGHDAAASDGASARFRVVVNVKASFREVCAEAAQLTSEAARLRSELMAAWKKNAALTKE
eukprot:1638798-Pleurochrysis_carterae.AAC.1